MGINNGRPSAISTHYYDDECQISKRVPLAHEAGRHRTQVRCLPSDLAPAPIAVCLAMEARIIIIIISVINNKFAC